jgi:hypothetical protein
VKGPTLLLLTTTSTRITQPPSPRQKRKRIERKNEEIVVKTKRFVPEMRHKHFRGGGQTFSQREREEKTKSFLMALSTGKECTGS